MRVQVAAMDFAEPSGSLSDQMGSQPRWGQLTAGGGLGVGDEARNVLLHQAAQPGLLGTVALTVDRGAIRCPL